MKVSIKEMTRTVFMVVPAFVLASALSAPAMADSYGEYACYDKENYGKGKKDRYGKHHIMGEHMQKRLIKKLDLTDAQEDSFKTVFENHRINMQSQGEASCMMFDKLATLTPGSAEYNQQIDKIANASAINMALNMKAWGHAHAEIMGMLNEEQMEEFQEMLEDMEERRRR